MTPNTIHDILPAPIGCNTIPFRKGTVLITAAGFEDRALAVRDLVVPGTHGRALVLDYRPIDQTNRLDELRDALSSDGWDVSCLVYDRVDPSAYLEGLVAALGEAAAVTVNASAMSKLAILLTLEACRRRDVPTDILYTEAKSYGPSQEQYEQAKEEGLIHSPSIHSYTGVHGSVRVPPFSSVAMQGSPLAALVFMSFNEQLTQTLLNEVYPARLLLINGRPPKHRWREDATAWIHRQLLQEWPGEDNPVDDSGLPVRCTSTLDYRETVELLLRAYWDLATHHRIMISPSGSKMQAVGVFVAWAVHPDIHIEYATPKGYLPTYSTGIGQSWRISLPPMDQFVTQCREVDRAANLRVLA